MSVDRAHRPLPDALPRCAKLRARLRARTDPDPPSPHLAGRCITGFYLMMLV